MGKRKYAESIYGKFSQDLIFDFEKNFNFINNINKKKERMLLINIHIGVRNLMKDEINVNEFFTSKLEFLKPCIIIGNEIGSGVIPVDKFERRWRDETGLLYQWIASEAEIVDRVWAGLALRLKG